MSQASVSPLPTTIDAQTDLTSNPNDNMQPFFDSTNTPPGSRHSQTQQTDSKRKSSASGVIYTQGYPSPAASQAASPLAPPQLSTFNGSATVRPQQGSVIATQNTTGIEAAPSPAGSSKIPRPVSGSSSSSAYSVPAIPPFNPSTLPAIPPFNPNSRKRRQQEVEEMEKAPEISARTSSNRDRQYLAPQNAAVPPLGSSPNVYRPTGRPATANVMQSLPYTPDTNTNNSRGAASTGARQQKADRASYQIPVAPNTLASSNPNPGMGIHQQPSYQLSASQAQSGRPRIFFGPYQLLQTLGEGEFGKVKLGILGDQRWGEEFAIKLMKRGSVQESQQRMTKVFREIAVLKVVKHPNIVRLADVIETEKYIGIVLEYASGGELFDHILAHRYLKDRDASKLFAQLISGVAYMHAKKIVHRDLKLENLLLDRHRNIMITDFGFANRYEDKEDDLMATSCGSPCYAAPELVVQDGKYVGSAVDVWSCGVILYAMLAGFLPYDDDPANPDSENINLLYKYILNTPLSFPDWIGPSPRSLLLQMLVPDPMKRCTLDDVARHPWLQKYTSLFQKSVEDLEDAAEAKAIAQKQALARQHEAIIQAEQQHAANMTRSHSSTVASKHQSAAVQSHHFTRPQPFSHVSQQAVPSRRAHAQSAIVVPSSAAVPTETTPTLATVDAFSYDRTSAMPVGLPVPESATMVPSASAPGRSVTPEKTEAAVSSPSAITAPIPSTSAANSTSPEEQARRQKAQAHRYTVQVEYSSEVRPQTSERRNEPVSEKKAIVGTEIEQSSFQPSRETSKSSAINDPVLPPAIPMVTSPPNDDTTVPFPSPEREIRTQEPAKTHVARSASNASARPPSAGSSRSKHTKQGSSDRFSISRFLGSSQSSVVGKSSAAQEGEIDDKKKSNRRKALSLVVEPFKPTRAKRSSVRIQEANLAASLNDSTASRPRTRSTIITPGPPTPSPAEVTPPAVRTSPRKTQTRPETAQMPDDAAWIANGPPANKAKRVMDWFRWRSMPRDESFSNIKRAADQLMVVDEASHAPQTPAPQVVVTDVPVSSIDSPNPADARAEQEMPAPKTQPALAPAPVADLRRGNSVSAATHISPQITSSNSTFNESRLRFHSGAVDQNALTSRTPPAVLEDLRQVLWAMGIEVKEEVGPYRLKCTRQSSKRVALAYGTSVTNVHQGNVHATPVSATTPARVLSPVGSGLTASPSTTFKSLFARRGSSTSGAPMPSPAVSMHSVNSDSPDLLLSPLTPSVSNLGQSPVPFYGKNDSGSEVRFTVEVSRMKNLQNLYAIDVRRLKGNLWSYRDIYNELFSGLQ